MAERRSPFMIITCATLANSSKAAAIICSPWPIRLGWTSISTPRTNVGVQDISSMGEVDIKGPGAERLLNRLVVNDIANMEPGQMRYTTMCNENGGIVDDITVYKFNDEHFMIVTSSAPRKKAVRWLAEQPVGTSSYVTEISGAVALAVSKRATPA